jgi:hypothetical protein
MSCCGKPTDGVDTLENLTVQTDLKVEGDLKLADGTAAAPSLHFSDDTDTGMYREGTNSLGFTTNGVKRLKLDTTEAEFAGVIQGPNGAEGAPTYSFTSNGTSGMYTKSDDVVITQLGSDVATLNSTGLTLNAGQFLAPNGLASAPAYSFTSGTEGMYSDGTNVILSAGDTARVTVGASDVTFTNDVVVSGTTQSTTKDTGALIIEGGAGIEKDVFVGGKVDVTTGIVLPTSGGTASTLDYYEEYSAAESIYGTDRTSDFFTTAKTMTIQFIRIGNVVTFQWENEISTVASSGSNYMVLAGAIPTRFRPSYSHNISMPVYAHNNATDVFGTVLIRLDGDIRFYGGLTSATS